MDDKELKVGDMVRRWKIIKKRRKGKPMYDAEIVMAQLGIIRKILPNKYVIQTSHKDGKPYIGCFNKKLWSKCYIDPSFF